MLYKWLKNIVLLLFAPHFSKSSCTIISQLPIPLRAHQLGYGKDPNIIYLFSGLTTGAQPTNNIYKWNVTAPMTFTTLSLTTPTSKFASYSNNAVSMNDKIYFVGTDDGSWESDIYIFDVIAEMWIDNTNIYKPPHPAIYGCLTANTTHLFFIGGKNTSTTFLNNLRIYDINNNTWFDEQIDIAPIKDNGWSHGYCEFVNEYLYVFGGIVIDTNNIINHIFKWNPTEKWSNIGYLPSVQSRGTAVHNDYSIYLIGGYSGGVTWIDSIYEFNTNIDEITNVYYMTRLLDELTARIINNKLYVFGGTALFVTDDVQICDIINTSAPTALSSTEPTTVNPTTSTPTTAPSVSTTTTATTTATTYTITNRLKTTYSYNGLQSIFSTNIDTLKTTEELKDKDDKELDNGVPLLMILIFTNVIIAVVILFVVIAICVYCYRQRQIKYEKKPHRNAKKVDYKEQQPQNQVALERANSESNDHNDKNNNDLGCNKEIGEDLQGNVLQEENTTTRRHSTTQPQIVYNLNNAGDQEIIGDDDMQTVGDDRNITVE